MPPEHEWQYTPSEELELSLVERLRHFPREPEMYVYALRSGAALGLRAGMSREKALYALTMAGAIMLDLQDRVGSLEPGKDADFIVLDGDPLSVYTHVQETWIDGERVFDRSNEKDRMYATGGYGASNDQVMHLHILEQEAGQ